MNFNWSDFLTLARELVGRKVRPYDSREAKARSAISRAYYAAFIEARNFLRDKEGKEASATDHPHAFVIDNFRKNTNPTRRRIGDKLDELRRYRRYADYQDRLYDIPKRVNISLQLADEIIRELERL
jgi:uncharacterized protein (UPF0332 family)